MDKQEFDKLAERLGSPYAAINYLARSARDLLEHNNGLVLESKAISWALTGEQPKLHKPIKPFWISELDNILSTIDDDRICESVRTSYICSLKQHHLIYHYHTDLDTSEQARVRVLVNMLWYK